MLPRVLCSATLHPFWRLSYKWVLHQAHFVQNSGSGRELGTHEYGLIHVLLCVVRYEYEMRSIVRVSQTLHFPPSFLLFMLSFSWQIDSLHRARPVVSRVTGTEQGHVSQARGQFILQDIHKVHFRNVRRIYFISGFQFNEFNHDFDANNACPEFQDVVFWAGFDCLSLLPLFTFFQDFAL